MILIFYSMFKKIALLISKVFLVSIISIILYLEFVEIIKYSNLLNAFKNDLTLFIPVSLLFSGTTSILFSIKNLISKEAVNHKFNFLFAGNIIFAILLIIFSIAAFITMIVSNNFKGIRNLITYLMLLYSFILGTLICYKSFKSYKLN